MGQRCTEVQPTGGSLGPGRLWTVGHHDIHLAQGTNAPT
jgi:hypothetical protein